MLINFFQLFTWNDGVRFKCKYIFESMDQIPFARLFKGNLFGSSFASYVVEDPGEGPGSPPPPILYNFHFSTFPRFGVNRKGHKLFNSDFASDK